MSSASSGGPGSNPFGVQFTPAEEEEFGEMARSEGFYEQFAKSVAPSIYGCLGLCLPHVTAFYTHFGLQTSKRQ
jgi:DNA replication licensing factor MCM5